MTIQINADDVIRRISDLSQLRRFRAEMQAILVYIRGKIARYPLSSHRPQPFVSDKQRRGFFAKLKAGEIEVPYRRGISPGSEKLGQSWNYRVANGGLSGYVGTAVSYASLVQGPDQTAYHAGTGWKTVDQVADEEREFVIRHLTDALARDVSGGG